MQSVQLQSETRNRPDGIAMAIRNLARSLDLARSRGVDTTYHARSAGLVLSCWLDDGIHEGDLVAALESTARSLAKAGIQ